MNGVFNCISDKALIWRALKTMPFGILLAWGYLSLGMLGIYFTWRALVKIGWPTWQWSWFGRLLTQGLKWAVLIFVLQMIFACFFTNPAIHLPPRDRGEWDCEDVILTRAEMPAPFSQWEWALRQRYAGNPRSNWWARHYCNAYLRPPGVRFQDEPYPSVRETYINFFVMESATYQEPKVVWSYLEEDFGTAPVEASWASDFTSCYACAWRLVETPEGSVVYWGVYDEFVLVVSFNQEALAYPEAMRQVLRAQDEKLGRWIEATRVEHLPFPQQACATPTAPSGAGGHEGP